MDDSGKDGKVTRRAVLQHGALLGGTLMLGSSVINLAACGSDTQEGPDAGDTTVADSVTDAGDTADPQQPVGHDDVVFGLFPSAEMPSSEDAIREVCQHLDFSWLSSGESVFVKVAANSGNPHPSVAAPAAVRALVAELRDRGAGRILVGDQCGIMHVRLAPGDQTYSSSRQRFDENGLLAAIDESGAEAHFFDEQGYEEGYFSATLPQQGHWSREMFIPAIVREVDHIVYLTRLGVHGLAGYTLGLKNAIGFLRDDSRYYLHNEADTFHEKYVEINFAAEIRDRLRLVVTLAEAALLDFGPDEGTIATVDPRIVIASRNVVHHDALALGVLVHLDNIIAKDPSVLVTYDRNTADVLNRMLVGSVVTSGTGITWGPDPGEDYVNMVPHVFEDGISTDHALSRAWELLGGRPTTIPVRLLGAEPDSDLRSFLETHGEGLWAFV